MNPKTFLYKTAVSVLVYFTKPVSLFNKKKLNNYVERNLPLTLIISKPFILATVCRRPLILQTSNSAMYRSNSQSLHQTSTNIYMILKSLRRFKISFSLRFFTFSNYFIFLLKSVRSK